MIALTQSHHLLKTEHSRNALVPVHKDAVRLNIESLTATITQSWSQQVEEITAAKARLLHSAGLTTLEEIAMSEEESVAKALSAGIRNRKPDAQHASLKVGKTGASGTNALVARDARAILQGNSVEQSPIMPCRLASGALWHAHSLQLCSG